MASDLPCYANRYIVDGYRVNTVPKATRFIKEKLKNWGNRGIVVFSITEQDGKDAVKAFLKAAMKFPNAGYTSCPSRNHGDYRCYLVLVPCNGGNLKSK